jgi:hypothetical protein
MAIEKLIINYKVKKITWNNSQIKNPEKSHKIKLTRSDIIKKNQNMHI